MSLDSNMKLGYRTSVAALERAWLRKALYGYAQRSCVFTTSDRTTMSSRQKPAWRMWR